MQNRFLTVSTSIRLRCEEAERRLLASGESTIAAVLTWTTEGKLGSGSSLPEVYCTPIPVEIFTIRLGKIHERDRQGYSGVTGQRANFSLNNHLCGHNLTNKEVAITGNV